MRDTGRRGGKRESENEYEKSWSVVPLMSSQQQVQVIGSVCECVARENQRMSVRNLCPEFL